VAGKLQIAGLRLVLDKKHWCARRASLGRDAIDPRNNLCGFKGAMFTFAQTLLNIDDKKGCLHGVGCSTKVACGQRSAGLA
jgi:hypothetical protein